MITPADNASSLAANVRSAIESRLHAALPGAHVELRDMTGTANHWEATVVSPAFDGQSQVARHRAVFQALGELMEGPIHALTLRTWTPKQARQALPPNDASGLSASGRSAGDVVGRR